MRKYIALILTTLALGTTALPAGAQDVRFDHRTLGDRTLSLHLGTLLPLFFQDLNGHANWANLSVGADLGLEVDVYLTNNWKMGGAVYGMMSFTPNARTFFMVPLLYRNTYEFKSYPFTFPVSLGVGMSYSAVGDQLNLDFSMMPQVGAIWNFSSDLGVGITANYLWIPQIYSGNPVSSDQSRLGNFLNLNLSFTYHF